MFARGDIFVPMDADTQSAADDRPMDGVRRQKKNRSPSYPNIPLDIALERARVMYREEGRRAVPVPALVVHWGYSPKSSGGLLTVAAMKKFGLLEDQGSAELRKASLTPLAMRILL